MAKKMRLGRGLSDMEGLNRLLNAGVDDAEVREQLQYISVDKLIANPDQPRTMFDEAALADLAQSIQLQGILQPLLVRPSPDEEDCFEIIAGERRWRAARQAKLAEVPCIVRSDIEQSTLELALIENIQRENLSAMELARSYEELVRRHSYTQDTLAEKLGLSRAAVANTLRLLKLSTVVQTMVADGRIVEGAARQLVRIADPSAQVEVAKFIAEDEIPVRQVERMVDACMAQGVDTVLTIWRQDVPRVAKSTGTKAASRRTRNPDSSAEPSVRALQEEMESILGTTVRISDKGKQGGTIRIEYYSPDDFTKVYNLLMSLKSDSAD